MNQNLTTKVNSNYYLSRLINQYSKQVPQVVFLIGMLLIAGVIIFVSYSPVFALQSGAENVSKFSVQPKFEKGIVLKGDPVQDYSHFLVFDRMEKGHIKEKALGQDDKILKKWFGPLGSIGVTAEIFLRTLGAIILGFFLAGSIFVLLLFLLKKQVAVRTKYLELEIQERKKVEKALRESNDKFLSLIANAPGYIAFVNADTLRYEAVNNAFEKSFGIPEGQIVGSHISEIIGETNYQFAKKYIDEVKLGNSISYENSFNLVSGKHWIQVNYAPVMNASGQVASIVVISSDITERKRVEDALRESQARYQLIFENSGTANAIFDTECRLILQNSLSIQRLGTKPGEALGKTALEIFGAEQGLVVTERMQSVLASSVTESFETKFDLPTGTKWFRSTYLPIFNEQQILVGVQVISQDITEQKIVGENLRDSEAQLRKAQHFAHIGSWTWNIKTNQLDWSDEMYNIFDLDKKTFSGSLFDVITQAIHPDDRAKVDQSNLAVVLEGKPSPLEYRIVWGDGSVHVVWAEAGEMLRDESGSPAFLIGTVQEITERKLAEETLRKSEERLRLSLQAARQGLYDINVQTGEAIVNPEYAQMLGYEPETFVESNSAWIERLHPDDQAATSKAYFDCVGGLSPEYRIEFRQRTKDGKWKWILSLGRVVEYDTQGKPLRMLGTHTDITERKQAEELIRQYATDLELHVEERTADLSRVNLDLARALRSRDEFLASMSHELRTPLTGILGLSEALQLNTFGELNSQQQKTLATIEASGRHLLDLINDILDLSKIEAGKLELQFALFSIADVCQASLQLTKGMAHQKNQKVLYAPGTEPVLIRADIRRLKQVLVNLLGNAIKFTPENGELGLDIQTNESEKTVKLTVWDKGIGIEVENLPKLFKPFVQLDSSLARQYPGTGLGLSLAQRLTEMHNGHIDVESVFGEGSRFIVTLPWSPQASPLISSEQTVDMRGMFRSVNSSKNSKSHLVMIADDNETVLQMVADFLETKQYRVLKVRSGIELLERVSEVQPDILLVDIQMPDMDGLETIRSIRAHADPLIAVLPVIAITALAMQGDCELCLQAGANEYMSKPLKLLELVAAIQKLIEDKF